MPTKSAWVIVAYEESKGLGDFLFDSDGNRCEEGDEDCEVVDGDGIEDEFDWLENKKFEHASEAAVTANPGGTYFYAIWNQWREGSDENVFDGDAVFRRAMYIDE